MPYIFRQPTDKKRRLTSTPNQPNWNSLLNYWAKTYPFPGYTPEPFPGVDAPGGGPPEYPSEYAAVIAEGQKYLGYSYYWGGKTPPYFDCSGFVGWCYKQVGVIPESVVSYTGTLRAYCIQVTDSSARPGDLVFWAGNSGESGAHVAIYIGNNQILDCSGSGVAYRPLNWHDSVLTRIGFFRPPKWMEV